MFVYVISVHSRHSCLIPVIVPCPPQFMINIHPTWEGGKRIITIKLFTFAVWYFILQSWGCLTEWSGYQIVVWTFPPNYNGACGLWTFNWYQISLKWHPTMTSHWVLLPWGPLQHFPGSQIKILMEPSSHSDKYEIEPEQFVERKSIPT